MNDKETEQPVGGRFGPIPTIAGEQRIKQADASTEKLGVYYGGPIWTNEELAERFGRKVVDGLIGNASLEYLEYFARLAGSYGGMALRERAERDNEVRS